MNNEFNPANFSNLSRENQIKEISKLTDNTQISAWMRESKHNIKHKDIVNYKKNQKNPTEQKTDEIKPSINKNDIKEETLFIEISKLHSNPHQARILFDETRTLELASNIETTGLKQAIDVAVDPIDQTHYIVAGERRTKAHIINNKKNIKANVRYPKNREELISLLVRDMWNENEQSQDISSIEKGVFFRKKLRNPKNDDKKSVRIKRYESIKHFATHLLGYEKIKKFTDEQTLLFSNKVKLISKYAGSNAKTTDHIEDEIEFNNGTEYDFLMIKIAELGNLFGLERVSTGKFRLNKKKSRKKPPENIEEIYKKFDTKKKELLETIPKSELQNTMFATLTDEERYWIENRDLNKKQNLINKFYDKANKSNFKPPFNSIEDEQKFRNEIEKQYSLLLAMAKASKETSINNQTKKFTGSIIKNNGKKISASVDLSKLTDEKKNKIKDLMNKLEEILKEEN